MSPVTDIQAVRCLLTADLPPIAADTRALAWDRVLSDVTAPRDRRARARRRTRRTRPATLRIAVAGAVAVIIVVATFVLGSGGSNTVPSPLGVAPAQAAAVLERAARNVADSQPLTGTETRVIRSTMLQLIPQADRHGRHYFYVLPRTQISGSDTLGGSFYEELPDGTPQFASRAAQAAYDRAFGRYVPVPPKPRIETRLGPDAPQPNDLNLSARQVAALPSDPLALKAALFAQRAGLRKQSEPAGVLFVVSRLLTFGPTPPAVQAGLTRLLATLPGARADGTARIGGRLADIVAFPAPHGVSESERLAFDHSTGQLLEQIDVLAGRFSGFPELRPGTVLDAIAFSTAIAPRLNAPLRPPAVMPVDGPRP